MWSNGLRWMFLILGTVIGAGYASGRELWQFFGAESGLAIFIFTILFIVCCYVIMRISMDQQSEHFSPVLVKLVGSKLSKVYEIIILLYLFTTTIVMLAGGGAALQVFFIPYWAGIIIISSLLILLFVYGVNGMITVNTWVIPIIVLVLGGILIHATDMSVITASSLLEKQNNWPSAFTFTALNILPLVAVLSAIGNKVASKNEIIIASLGSGLVLGIISFVYNETLLSVATKIEFFEIPLFAIIQSYPYYMLFFMTLLLWVAIYTTAASGLLGLTTRLRSIFNLPLWVVCAIMLAIMIPFTTFGFSLLVSVLYPLFGLINLYLLVAILLYPIANKYNWS
ncbi:MULTISPECIES: YkvI family membrane protein [Bacillus]|uniref:YkvI family membrane protein n=1 Tax=Bacillus TaxID=1386 RepID=UPI000BB92D6B|nr:MULTISPECIES: hypothetical protein [Bacillus]